MLLFFFFKQKTAYEMRISDWSSDVCSSGLTALRSQDTTGAHLHGVGADRLLRHGRRALDGPRRCQRAPDPRPGGRGAGLRVGWPAAVDRQALDRKSVV